MFNRALDPVLMEMLVCIADEGSFTRAAERLHLTQQAVSAQMKRLEAMAGQELAVRAQGGVRLTPAGEALLVHARQVVAIATRVRHQFSAIPLDGIIRFGFTPGFGLSLLFPLLSEIRRLHPKLELHCEVRRTVELLPRFHAGSLDVIIGAQPTGAIFGEVLVRQNLQWVGNLGGLAAPPAPIPLAILPYPTFLREQVLGILSAAGLSWTIFFESDDFNTLRAAVQAGWGISAVNRALAVEMGPFQDELAPSFLPSPGVVEFYLLHREDTQGPYESFAHALRTLIRSGHGGWSPSGPGDGVTP